MPSPSSGPPALRRSGLSGREDGELVALRWAKPQSAGFGALGPGGRAVRFQLVRERSCVDLVYLAVRSYRLPAPNAAAWGRRVSVCAPTRLARADAVRCDHDQGAAQTTYAWTVAAAPSAVSACACHCVGGCALVGGEESKRNESA